jgi:hypothetical protein
MDNGQEDTRGGYDARRSTAIGFIVGAMLGGLADLFTGNLGTGTLLGMALGSLLGYYGLRRIHWMEYRKGDMLRFGLTAVLFLATFLITYSLLEGDTSESFRRILPLAPIVPGMLMLLALGRALSNLDELQRRIQIEAIAIGFGITAFFALTVGLFGLSGTPQPNWMMVPAVMVFSWLLGKLWTRWKYR